jgi:AraC-like DNA-binding protein
LKPYITAGAYASFLKTLPAVPLVSVGEPVPGFPSITVENRVGMDRLVTHLVGEHGCRKIAIIKGPENSVDAQARFQAFRVALARHGLHNNPDLVIPGSFYAESARRAVAHLVDDRKLEFDALIGSNDHTALFVIAELKRRGYRIPEDVIVVGYDDDRECRSGRPPLTTVRQPCFELGYEAARKVYALLDGEPDAADVILESRLAVRESCGCRGAGRDGGGKNNDAERDGGEALNHFRLIDMRLYGFRKRIHTLSRWEELSDLMQSSLPHFAITSCFVFSDRRNSGECAAAGYRMLFSCTAGGTTAAPVRGAVVSPEKEIASCVSGYVQEEVCIVCPLIYGDDLSGYIGFGIDRTAFAAGLETGVHPGKVCESLAMELGALVHTLGGNGKRAPRSSVGTDGQAAGGPAAFSLPEHKSLEIFNKLVRYMKRVKPYIDEELSLHKLSEKLRIPRNYLSCAINKHGGSNFYRFIFHYRIQEAGRLLSRSAPGRINILDIAYQCGFRSKSTFNKAFKLQTGMTPTEFKLTGASGGRRK